MELSFTSQLPSSFFNELNALFFFNPNQALYSSEILHSIETFGVPKIVIDGDNLRLIIGDGSSAQCLFCLLNRNSESVLCGVIAYTRTRPEVLNLIHVVVKEEYALFGALGDQRLLTRMLDEVKDVARKIKGVRAIYVVYARREILVE